jgi:hypothetical protein
MKTGSGIERVYVPSEAQVLDIMNKIISDISKSNHYHPINVPTAGAQAFLMDYT